MQHYNQQLNFDFEDRRLIKEVTIKYFEEIDTDGKRRIKKETSEKKWFNEGGKHNPACSHHFEVL